MQLQFKLNVIYIWLKISNHLSNIKALISLEKIKKLNFYGYTTFTSLTPENKLANVSHTITCISMAKLNNKYKLSWQTVVFLLKRSKIENPFWIYKQQCLLLSEGILLWQIFCMWKIENPFCICKTFYFLSIRTFFLNRSPLVSTFKDIFT